LGGARLTDEERKRKGGQSHTAPRAGRKMGGLVRRTLELEGAVTPARARQRRVAHVCDESRGGGAMAVSCWAG
jgi:hypothetical protein